MPQIRCRANMGFSGAGQDVTQDEIVVVDAASWAPWIEAGFLTPLDVGDESGPEQRTDAPVMQGLPGELTVTQEDPQ